MDTSHGHVIPNPDGSKARCGGPTVCSACALEFAQHHSFKVPSSMDTSHRHPSTQQICQYFGYKHLPAHLQPTSKPCHDLATAMLGELPDGPELTAGLRKLLEAKDCFVRAALPQAGREP